MSNYIIDTSKTTSNRRYLTKLINSANSHLPRRYKLERCYRSTIDGIVFQYAQHLLSYRQRSNNFDHQDALCVTIPIGTWAHHLDCSSETVRRHFKKLEEFGFIIRKRILGAVKIYVNPLTFDLVNEHLKGAEMPPLHLKIRYNLNRIFADSAAKNEKIRAAENQSLNSTKHTTCECLYTSEGVNNINLSPTVVKKLITLSKQELSAETARNFQDARKNLENPVDYQKEIAAAKRKNTIMRMSDELWTFVLDKIYKPQYGGNLIFQFQSEFALNYFRIELSKMGDHLLLFFLFHFCSLIKAL